MDGVLWAIGTLGAAFAVAAAATPLVSRLALALNAVDRPNERTVSLRARMPLLGGLSVALGFFVGLAVAFPLLGHATWHAYRDIRGG